VSGGDLILVNGHVLTMDPARPVAEALAIRDGMVLISGSRDEALAQRRSGTEVVDLEGATAVPAFNDAHCHPMSLGFDSEAVDARPETTPDIRNLAGKVRERAASLEPGAWVLARGYDDARFEERRHPNRTDLDAAAPDHPVFAYRACLHVAVANTKALKLAGITASTPDPEGGAIDRDARGAPTGILRESAIELVEAAMQPPGEHEIAHAIRRATDIYHAFGVTSVAEAGIRRPEELAAYRTLREEGGIALRTYLMVIIGEMTEVLSREGVCTGSGDALLRVGPAKLFADGSIGGRTARMREPYEGEPENHGLWALAPEEIRANLLSAHESGWQCAAHAIGDAAIDLLLDSYQEALTEHPRSDARPRIEHCEFITDPAVFDRIRRLGCVPVPGTTFLRDFRPLYVRNLGPPRLRYANAMKSFADRGIVAAASSDAPVVTPDPLAGISTMMTREDFAGEAAFPEEAVSFEEAVRAYTRAGAYASFEEGIKGSLTPGKLGDVAVLGADMRDVDPRDLPEVGVRFTVMGGRVVHAG
jgi:predicted amidohydrolase YtcJ